DLPLTGQLRVPSVINTDCADILSPGWHGFVPMVRHLVNQLGPRPASLGAARPGWRTVVAACRVAGYGRRQASGGRVHPLQFAVMLIPVPRGAYWTLGQYGW